MIRNSDGYLVMRERSLRRLGAPQLRPVPGTSDRRSFPGLLQYHRNRLVARKNAAAYG